jgi:hypothetical protein
MHDRPSTLTPGDPEVDITTGVVGAAARRTFLSCKYKAVRTHGPKPKSKSNDNKKKTKRLLSSNC